MTRTSNSNGTLNAYVVSPGEVRPGDLYGYKVVAVVYSGGFWAAYRGLTDDSDQEVAAYGDKLDRDQAAALFPTLAANLIYNI